MKTHALFKVPPALADIILGQADFSAPLDAKLAKTEGSTTDHAARRTDIVWLPRDWYDGVFTELAAAPNVFWQYDIRSGEDIQVGRYPPGGHYKMHSDFNPYDEDKPYHRKITVVMGLSDDYTGGELEISTKDSTELLRLNKGDVVVFPSWMTHRVHPVKTGVRYTAVKWLTGPHWR